MSSGGLGNLGLTCAVNTIIQCIVHTKTIREIFLNDPTITNMPNTTLSYQFRDIINLLYNEKACIAPHAFLHVLYLIFPNILRHGEQHDICELWMLIAEKLNDECSETVSEPKQSNIIHDDDIVFKVAKMIYECNKKKSSKWLECIQGVQLSITQCKNELCNKKYYNPELFITITLDIPKKGPINLSDMLLQFYGIDEFDDWKCDTCNTRHGAKKQAQLWKMPKVLIIVIKRFEMNEHGQFHKIHESVKIQDTLDFTFGQTSHKYQLTAIGNHFGSYQGGHYTATIRDLNKWKIYDDAHSHMIEGNEFLNGNRDAYMMFYEQY
jgi:ubiquitin C-terminal hydrolase